MTPKSDAYRTLLISKIPAERRGREYVTNSLWSRDINTNIRTVSDISLICPVQKVSDTEAQPLDPRIKVSDSNHLTLDQLETLIRQTDVVEIPGNFHWLGAKLSRQAARLAKRHGKISVLGISSNRAKTTIMNTAGRGFPTRIRAWIRAASIRLSQIYLARNCDGVRVVGEGLRPLVEKHAKDLHIGVASWIQDADFHDLNKPKTELVSVVIASRLEPMKGVHIGIEAVAKALTEGGNIELKVIGEGREEQRLRDLIQEREMSETTHFLGTLSYPEPFFDTLRQSNFVLLTNLNDEQPRLIFDAISQGAIPICPRNRAYEALGIDARVLYTQGVATSLCDTIQKLCAASASEMADLQEQLTAFAKSRTLDTMHQHRRDWVLSLLLKKTVH